MTSNTSTVAATVNEEETAIDIATTWALALHKGMSEKDESSLKNLFQENAVLRDLLARHGEIYMVVRAAHVDVKLALV